MRRKKAFRKTALRKAAFRKTQNKFSIFMAVLVVLMITVVVAVKRVGLEARIETLAAREEQLQHQITKEEERKEEIEQYRKFTQTKQFVEQVAKEKLGLMYEGEIMFKQGN